MLLVPCNPAVRVWDRWRSTSILASVSVSLRMCWETASHLHLVYMGKTNGPGSSLRFVFDLQQWMPWRRSWKVNRMTVPAPGRLFSVWKGAEWCSFCLISAGDHLTDPLILQAWDLITLGLSVCAYVKAVNITPVVLPNFVKLPNFITVSYKEVRLVRRGSLLSQPVTSGQAQ